MADIIIIAILLLLGSSIAFFLHREKKRGVKCVGCPYAKQCAGKCSCTGN